MGSPMTSAQMCPPCRGFRDFGATSCQDGFLGGVQFFLGFLLGSSSDLVERFELFLGFLGLDKQVIPMQTPFVGLSLDRHSVGEMLLRTGCSSDRLVTAWWGCCWEFQIWEGKSSEA